MQLLKMKHFILLQKLEHYFDVVRSGSVSVLTSEDNPAPFCVCRLWIEHQVTKRLFYLNVTFSNAILEEEQQEEYPKKVDEGIQEEAAART